MSMKVTHALITGGKDKIQELIDNSSITAGTLCLTNDGKYYFVGSDLTIRGIADNELIFESMDEANAYLQEQGENAVPGRVITAKNGEVYVQYIIQKTPEGTFEFAESSEGSGGSGEDAPVWKEF